MTPTPRIGIPAKMWEEIWESTQDALHASAADQRLAFTQIGAKYHFTEQQLIDGGIIQPPPTIPIDRPMLKGARTHREPGE